MKIIKLTSFKNNSPVYINVDHIGDFFGTEKICYTTGKVSSYTRVGVTTHNNGGFQVQETPEEILALINDTSNIITERQRLYQCIEEAMIRAEYADENWKDSDTAWLAVRKILNEI